jgi:hypothetical protein
LEWTIQWRQGVLDVPKDFLPPTIATNREGLFGNELAPLLIFKEIELRSILAKKRMSSLLIIQKSQKMIVL